MDVHDSSKWTGLEPAIEAMDTIPLFHLGQAMGKWDHFPHDDSGRRFMEYLGIPSWQVIDDKVHMPSSSAIKVRQLLGPHYLTIIKAWYASKGNTQ